MGMFSSFLHPERGYKKGQEQLDKYYNMAQQQYQPFVNQGQQAYGHLTGAMENLLNPTQLYQDWMGSYQMSPQAQFEQNRAQESGLRAANAMGLGGSSPALQAIQAGTNEIGANDQQRYFDRLLAPYLQGASLAQGIYGQGANMAGQMGQNAMNMGGESANMAYGQANAPGQLFGSLLGTAANLGGAYMGMQGMNNLANSWRTMGGQGGQNNRPLPAYMGGQGYSAGGY